MALKAGYKGIKRVGPGLHLNRAGDLTIKGAVPTTLEQLSDVEIDTALGGDVLRYDSTNNVWEAEQPGTTPTEDSDELITSGGVYAALQEIQPVNADWEATSGPAEILNKPTIPAAQVNSDWNASSGVAEILNKPTIPDITNCYETTDTTEAVLSDDDKLPFYDDSANEKRSSTWSNIKSKLKSYFDGIYAAITAIGTYESGSTASRQYYSGEHFYKNGKFCTCKTNTAQGETWTLNTNYVEGTVAESLPLVPYDITSYDSISQTIANEGGGTIKSYNITKDALRVANIFITAKQTFTPSGNYKKWELGLRVNRNNTKYTISDYTIPANSIGSQIASGINAIFPVKAGDIVEVYIWNYLGSSCVFDGRIYFD